MRHERLVRGVAAWVAVWALVAIGRPPHAGRADGIAQSLPFTQAWTNVALITTDDDWSGVPGIIGYRGDNLTGATGTDPQTIVADGSATPVDVIANQTTPDTNNSGAVAEFEITNPTVAFQGSGTADAPHIVLHLDTTGLENIQVGYNLRDIDGSIDNAVQAVALQFRVGSTGDFTNVPAGFVADASSGPSLATLVTPVAAALPAAADNQPVVQVRIITTNAVSNDEWIGIDDILVTGSPTGPTPPSVDGAASPDVVSPGDTTLLTATVTPGANPASTGLTVTGDLSEIGGSAIQMFFDDGSNGDETGGDNIFSFSAVVDAATSPGPKSLALIVADAEARSGDGTISLSVQLAGTAPPVAISQAYGAGGTAGATLRNDFVELVNRGADPISLSGWSLQYAASGGSTWEVTPLSGSLGAGRYLLIQQASGGPSGANLPAPDVAGTIDLGTTAGKLALVRAPSALTGVCPSDPSLVDLVGYGSSADCFEGSGPAPSPSTTRSLLRSSQGCLDTNDNDADFLLGSPVPRNSASAAVDCEIAPPPPALPVAINQIQGSGGVSPFVGEVVTTPVSIVTGVRSNGFFIQTPDDSGENDGDPNTSEGVFVFTSGAPGSVAVVGNAVQVTGTVVEFIPSADLNSPPMTEISGPVTTLVSAGNPLPAPVTLSAADTSPLGSIEQLEKYEAMRVAVPSLTVVGPTMGSVTEATATSSSSGIFYGVIAGIDRPLREPGIEVPDPLPPGAPLGIPRFDANPERLRVASTGQVGGAAIDVAAGATVENLVGPLDYSFRTYTILPDPATPPTVIGNVLDATPVAIPTANQFTVASFNVRRLFDALNDPLISEPVLTTTAFHRRLHKTSLLIRDVLRTPDILAVEEVENLSTLEALARKINDDALAAGEPNPEYGAYLVEGIDVGGIDVGFLVKGSRVTPVAVVQEGKTATYVNPIDGSTEPLNDRPPLVLRATIQGPSGSPTALTVIAVHNRSLSGVDDPADGPRVRAKRRAQAEFLAQLIQARQVADPTERIVVLGDFNAFAFNDGYVDAMGTIRGTPTPASQVTLASPDLVNPDLLDLGELLPAVQRYSFIFDGNAQDLDHALVTQNLFGTVAAVQRARVNADFPEILSNDPQRPERVSDHDPIVAFFEFPQDTLTTVVSSDDTSVFGQFVTFTAAVTSGGSPVTSGSVVFKDGDLVLSSVNLNSSGQASFTTSSLSAGTHTITAVFSGSGLLGVSSASLLQTVDGSSTTVMITSDINPSGFNQSVTFTATVTGANGPAREGTVTFKEGTTVLGGPVTVNSQGKAALILSMLSLGAHVVIAEYSGSANLDPATGSMTQTVRPGVSIDDVSVSERNGAQTAAATFTVTLSAASGQPVVVTFSTFSDTAVAGSDYVARSGTVRFAPGVTLRRITIAVNSDVLNEADENFFVNLTAATNAVIVDGQGLGTITNDDPTPGLGINDVTVREGNSGTINAVFTVRLSAPSGRPVAAEFVTTDNTAASPEDYASQSGTLIFEPGAVTQTITVPVNGDTTTEGNDTFFVVLPSATNASIADGVGLGTITNDDANPSLAVADTTATEPTAGSTPAAFTVSLSSASDLTVTVQFATANGSATAGSDYTAATGTLTFAPGVVSQTIDVPVLADAVAEPVQTFSVRLSAPTSATIRDAQGVGSIFDASRPFVDSFTPLTGAVGSSVTITGSNFTGITSVRFNGVTATFTVNSPTQITAAVPAGASTGPISVSNAGGTGASALNFGVVPTINSFTPASGRVGRAVTINGSGFTGVTDVQFGGVAATVISATATVIRTTVPPGATTGPITVTTPVGTATSATNFTVVP